MRQIYLTFFTTHQSIINDHVRKYSSFEKENIVGTSKSMERKGDLGGIIVHYDLEQKAILNSHEILVPGGSCFLGDRILVASQIKNYIEVLDKNLTLLSIINNSLFNNVHSIFVTEDRTLIVTSTGLDAIIEIDLEGNLIWKWFAFEHGYDKDMFGNKREINCDRDYTNIDFPTLYHTTHVNAAIVDPKNSGKILATLFHQGEIVRVDKVTGQVEKVVSGLKNCHSLQHVDKTFICSNTKEGEVILFDEQFKKINLLKFDSKWIQDATITEWNTFLVGDSERNRILEWSLDESKIINIYEYNPEWRIYQILIR